jgi:type IV secretion system protein VirD4
MWAEPYALATPQRHIGLPALDARSQLLYGHALPRGVLVPRFTPDRPPVNFWMRPHELASHAYVPGQIILGKFGNVFLGHLDDRPMISIAGARAGKTKTVLEPNLYLYPGSCLILDPKGDLAKSARLRQALGHDVYILDPFGQSGEASASFNPLADLDPDRDTIIDDVALIAQAIIVDDGDSRAKHWNDSARALLQGILLFTLLMPEAERHLVSVRQLLTLAHPRLAWAVKNTIQAEDTKNQEKYYDENKIAVETLVGGMAKIENAFGGVLSAIGRRFLATPQSERGSIFSTAAAQTDFLDSLPLRAISRKSSFSLSALRSKRPTSIFLCLPVSRTQSHYRWLRMIVQLACLTLEHMGPYPRNRPPILFMAEEFATLGYMQIMERAAAYFPSFGVKLWIVLQDIGQLQLYKNAETFLGNAGLIQCFANNDGPTLDYIARRLEGLIHPFELRRAFSRNSQAQVLMMEGEAPAAAIRLEHSDVAAIRLRAYRLAQQRLARIGG